MMQRWTPGPRAVCPAMFSEPEGSKKRNRSLTLHFVLTSLVFWEGQAVSEEVASLAAIQACLC